MLSRNGVHLFKNRNNFTLLLLRSAVEIYGHDAIKVTRFNGWKKKYAYHVINLNYSWRSSE
jgi:hypothetical protein